MEPRLKKPPVIPAPRSNPPKAKQSLLTLLLSFAIALYGLSVLGSLIW